MSTPRCKRMKRKARLQSAQHWIPKYEGKNLVHGYARHFGVDELCAANELQMLGHEISPEYIKQLKQTALNRQRQAEARRLVEEEKKRLERFPDSDETFYYIAGYTSGGAPYGVTWEEMGMEPYGEEPDEQSPISSLELAAIPIEDEEDEELPF